MQYQERFWVRTDTSIVYDQNGFLHVPEPEDYGYSSGGPLPYAEIDHIPCLALLGEPGIGKTEEVKNIVSDLTSCYGQANVAYIDLSYCDPGLLKSEIDDVIDQFQGIKNVWPVFLFLDGLDESPIKHIGKLLSKHLSLLKTKFSRLKVRLACRTAVSSQLIPDSIEKLYESRYVRKYPNSDVDVLLKRMRGDIDTPPLPKQISRQFWPEDIFSRYELQPFQVMDVIAIAEGEDVDASVFMQQVMDRKVGPLAAKPITLKFMLDDFREGGMLHQRKTEIYKSGCRRLCCDPNSEKSALDTDRRLRIASRIAAMMVFGNKTRIALDDRTGEKKELLNIREIKGGPEKVNGSEFHVDEAIVQEVINTGLFNSRGSGYSGFTHQSFVEYLAAAYLIDHNLAVSKLATLICHQGQADQAVVPQLAETAGWLASMNGELCLQLMKSDPMILLRSDAAVLEHQQKAELIRCVFDKVRDAEYDYTDWSIDKQMARMKHDGFSAQLKSYITDPTEDRWVRDLAIKVAEEADEASLLDQLTQVALTKNESYLVTVSAVRAIAKMGKEEHLIKLKEVLLGDLSSDHHHEIRGTILSALFPKGLINVEEMLASLVHPDEAFLGAYELFLRESVMPGITTADLPAALSRMSEIDFSGPRFSRGLKAVSDQIVLAALDSFEMEDIQDAFVHFIMSRFPHHDDLVFDQKLRSSMVTFFEDENARRGLLLKLIAAVAQTEMDITHVAWTNPSLISDDDLSWLVDQALSIKDEALAIKYAQLAERIFSPHDLEHTESIFRAYQSRASLKEILKRHFRVIELDSELAHQLKEDHEKYWKRQQEVEEEEPIDPPMSQRIIQHLDRFEAGENEGWLAVNNDLLFEESGQPSEYGAIEPNLMKLPGWNEASEVTQLRIVNAAQQYVMSDIEDEGKWIATLSFPSVVLCAYRALVLLMNLERAFLESMPVAIWRKWAPIIIGYPRATGEQVPYLQQQAFKHASAQVYDTMHRMIDAQIANTKSEGVHLNRDLVELWDETFCDAVMARIQEKTANARSVQDLMQMLMEQQYAPVFTFARSALSGWNSEDARDKEIAKYAMRLLMLHAEDAAWDVVWPILQKDADATKEVLDAFTNGRGGASTLAEKINSMQIAELYIWLQRNVPDEERVPGRAWMMGTQDLKEALLRYLRDTGTNEAVLAIDYVIAELPELKWIKMARGMAKIQHRHNTWQPPEPQELLEFIKEANARLVRNAGELQDLVMECFSEIDKKLQGATYLAPILWNEKTYKDDPTLCRPKEENYLSDRLKNMLDEQLRHHAIICKREPELRRGEELDIEIEAFTSGDNAGELARVKVIVEVKGCWNKGVKKEMKEQLAGRYLAANDCKHGIYVVGWYLCPAWDEDSRKRATPKWSLEEAREYFDQQAEELSTDGLKIKSVVLDARLR